MSYQVLARKWRPQAFDEIVGQEGVTRTLRNAIASGRIGQSFIFAGARGVGKTTTARILAKALNCINGPTADPCGQCHACVEIAEGRNLDVLEIDAATHTQVDKVRDIIIENLSIRPARDRFKIFIIDEVHMLSNSSFNALLKSIEEPPPHVVFMMATTELHKIPDTIRSRSQEFEFRAINTRAIYEQLRKIAQAEGLTVEPAALQLMARSGEGSLRDAESAFDQVIAFAGASITAADVASVLGLVGRDLLLDMVEVVADEQAPRVFDLVGRAVESGHDLRLLCRELSRVVRDMMVVAIDPSRAEDPEYAPDGDVERLTALTARFSREDLLRAFDILARAEFEIRNSSQPRYHFEMTLFRWMHLRKLVAIEDLIAAVEQGGSGPSSGLPPRSGRPSTAPAPSRPAAGSTGGATARRIGEELAARKAAASTPAAPPSRNATVATPPPVAFEPGRSSASVGATVSETAVPLAVPSTPAQYKEQFLEEVRRWNKLFHGTVVAQAYSIDIADGAVVFGFTAQHKVLRQQLEQKRAAVEEIASRLASRPMKVTVIEVEGAAKGAASSGPADSEADRLRQRAMATSAVQAMLDVFPAQITDVEEIP
jgi:DNA polymerase-3 subunit gamma/tau